MVYCLPVPPCAPLADFGLANRSGLKNSLLSTFCGSVAYTAPEILMSKEYNREQADLWSLSGTHRLPSIGPMGGQERRYALRNLCPRGIVLHAVVTGELPLKGHQAHHMLHLMRHGPPSGQACTQVRENSLCPSQIPA
nr:testis-specific serine/threonine-protein kinase 5-like [Mirounga angustirostris]